MPVLLPKERLGSQLADKYELKSILGRGGMGIVYAGIHVWTGRPVAVKVMGPEFAEDERMAKRFLREARSAAALRHPNVVDVLDMGRANDGSVYLVLEHLRGHSLGDRLDEKGKLDVEETLATLLPVIDALSEAHRKGIVHRDIKPDNIFLSLDSRENVVPKLLDFGVAKVLRGKSAATQTGAVLGTPQYMSPEQARGSAEVGPASDVWALGVVMYQCLTGEYLYDTGDLLSTLGAIATGPDPELGELATHPAIRRTLERALKKDVELRFRDMEAFGLALRLAAHTAGVEISSDALPRVRSVPPASPAERAEQRRSERPPHGASYAKEPDPSFAMDEVPRKSGAPTRAQPLRPPPRFELELPPEAQRRPLPAQPPPPPDSEELELALADVPRTSLDPVARRPSTELAEGPHTSPFAWYDDLPPAARKAVRVLAIALVLSVGYGVGMALYRAFS